MTLAADFLDSFRFMDQLGSLAQRGVQTVMVNTLASSDYGLLDEETLEPRPNYWAALLWKRLMGNRVLKPGVVSEQATRVYAQCSVHGSGAVTVVVLNMDKTAAYDIGVPMDGQRYILSSADLLSRSISLNGIELRLLAKGALPPLTGDPFRAGVLHLPPTSITFLVFSGAKNPACE
jgi:heparanase